MTLPTRWWLSARLLTFFVGWAVFQSYWGVWMAGRGFDAVEIGVALATSLAGRTVSVGIVFPVLNRHATLLRLGRVLPWLVAAASVPYLFVGGFWSLIAMSAVFGLAFPLLMPLSETLATSAARQGLAQYGPTRAFGSAGFLVGTVAAGWLVAGFGADVLAPALVGACLLTALIGLVSPADAQAFATRGTGARGFSVLLRDRSFVMVLITASILQGTHAAYYGYGALRAGELAPAFAVPLLLVLAPLSELVLFASARGRFDRLGFRALLVIGGVVAAVRWILLALAGDWLLFGATQLLHAGSYAITHIAFNQYVRDRVGAGEQAAAQGLYASVAMGLTMALFTLIAGLVMPAGFGWALTTMAILAVLGLFAAPFTGRGTAR